MNVATTVATSRLVAQQRALDVSASNLANLTTPGFRAERVQFADWISRQPAGLPPPGIRSVSYTQDRATWRDLHAGAMAQTGNPLDLAITGDGYFTVQTTAGTRLTRAGKFTLAADGTVTDEAGHALLSSDGRPLKLPPEDTRITVSGDGTISSESGVLGRIGVVKPKDAMRLQAEGGQMYRTEEPTEPVAQPAIVQGTLETSNVQPVLETTRMMSGLREFQFVSQFIQAETDRQKEAIDRIVRQRN